jgi:hypothetical protein
MKKTSLEIKKDMQKRGLWFTQKEAKHLVNEAKKIGFVPLPFLVKDKNFDLKKVQGSISFLHKKTEETFCVERFEITNAGLNFEDNVVDIFITLIFKRWAEEIEIETQSRDI